MKKQTRRQPTASKFSLLRQVCNFIPPHLVPRLARETGVAEQARTFSPWSHIVSLLYAQITHSLGGTAKIGPTEYDIGVNGSGGPIDDLNNLPIKVVNGATLRLRDVAQVHDGYNPQVNAVRLDGVRGALLTIMKSGAASTLDVVASAKAALPRIMAGGSGLDQGVGRRLATPKKIALNRIFAHRNALSLAESH